MHKLITILAVCAAAFAQDPTGVLEGKVIDASGAVVPGATVTAVSPRTGATRQQTTTNAGAFHIPLPVGEYDLHVIAPKLAEFVEHGIQLNISQTTRVDVTLQVTKEKDVLNVTASATLVDSGSNSIGNVVTGRELVDLPLNGRNFTQLGLLQPGVAPMTAGLAAAGGSLRAGQAYSVNGQRPESNNYLLDGVTNVNRVDGGYALRTPVDAIQEFRILTQTAPAEYGGTSGATTTVVTRSGTQRLSRERSTSFSATMRWTRATSLRSEVEPLKQNQFGATLGGAHAQEQGFLLRLLRGFPQRQGVTQSATVPSDAQRVGDFSGVSDPQTGQPVPLINYFTRPALSGQPDSPYRAKRRSR